LDKKASTSITISQGTPLWNRNDYNQDYDEDLWLASQEIVPKYASITKLLTAKHEQDTTVNSFARRRDAMAVFPTGVRKSMIFTVFYFLHSPGKNCRLRKILSLNFTAIELSYDVLRSFLV